MTSFTKPLIVRHIDGILWEVMESFDYFLKDDPDTVISVPVGFECDFASIPRIFWTLIGHPTGKYGKAAIIHDFIYRRHMFPRKKCDDIFLEAMEVLGVNKIKRHLMYYFVRTLGCIPWNRYPASDSLKNI